VIRPADEEEVTRTVTIAITATNATIAETFAVVIDAKTILRQQKQPS
jgi:hypothetical protein